MTKNDKHSYHHGNLRDELMKVAVKHLNEAGVENLSLRAIARELEVSQTAPYRHFNDKNSLLAALAVDGFNTLKNEMLAAIKQCSHKNIHALQSCGIAYVNFARKNPEKYQLMFSQGIINRQQYTELMSSSKAAFKVLQEVIEQGIQHGSFKEQQIEMVSNTAWALVHGLSTLIIDRLQWTMSNEAIEKQIEFSTRSLIDKL